MHGACESTVLAALSVMTRGQSRAKKSTQGPAQETAQQPVQQPEQSRQTAQSDTEMVDTVADHDGAAGDAGQEMASADQESDLSETSGSGAESGFIERYAQPIEVDPNFVNSGFTKHLTFKDGLWFKDQTLVVPKVGNLRQECMREMHDTPLSGHLELRKQSWDCFGGPLSARLSNTMCRHVTVAKGQ